MAAGSPVISDGSVLGSTTLRASTSVTRVASWMDWLRAAARPATAPTAPTAMATSRLTRPNRTSACRVLAAPVASWDGRTDRDCRTSRVLRRRPTACLGSSASRFILLR